MDKLFKAFHTTKKEVGDTKLGLCVVKSIVEGHGGRISAFSRKHAKGVLGLGMNLVFPIFNELLEKNEDEKSKIVFITHGIKDLSIPLQIFRNSLVNPIAFNNARDIDSDCNFKKIYAVIGVPESIHLFKTRFKTDLTFYALVEEGQTGLFILDELGEDDPVLFSEEFLLSRIISKQNPDK